MLEQSRVMAAVLHKVLLVSISCFCYGAGLGLVLVAGLQIQDIISMFVFRY